MVHDVVGEHAVIEAPEDAVDQVAVDFNATRVKGNWLLKLVGGHQITLTEYCVIAGS